MFLSEFSDINVFSLPSMIFHDWICHRMFIHFQIVGNYIKFQAMIKGCNKNSMSILCEYKFWNSLGEYENAPWQGKVLALCCNTTPNSFKSYHKLHFHKEWRQFRISKTYSTICSVNEKYFQYSHKYITVYNLI